MRLPDFWGVKESRVPMGEQAVSNGAKGCEMGISSALDEWMVSDSRPCKVH
jgi:hypothetical protein